MKWLNPEEKSKVEAWLDSGDTPGYKHGPWYRLFIAIALESGLRLNEIIALTHGQANLLSGHWEGVLRLKRKDKARIDANLGPRTARIYEEMFGKKEPGIETSIFDGGPRDNDCYKFCRRLGDQIGIHRLTPHRFRHTVGRDLDQAGFSPSKIKKALGHSTGTMALLYSEATNDEAINALKTIRGDEEDD